MSKRNKKNLITLVLLILLLALLTVFYFWNKNRDRDENNKSNPDKVDMEDDSNPLIYTLDKEKINKIHISNDELDITLLLDGQTWKDENDSKRPINQTIVQNMINTVEEVRAIQVVNNSPEDLQEYGLGNAAIKVEVEQSDGKSLKLKIGQSAITSEGYYSLINDDGIVYLISNSYASSFGYTDKDMTALPTGPDIDPQYIYHIEVLKKDGEDFELLYDPEADTSGSDLFPWTILKPFEEAYSADGSKVSEIQPIFGNFDFVACVEYDSEDLDKYSLEEPEATIYVGYNKYQTVTLDEPETSPETGEEITEKTYHEELDYKIHVGSKDENGNYYVREEGSKAVYIMESDKIEPMLEVEVIDVISSFVLIPSISLVDSIDIEIDGKSYTMKIKRTPATDEDGEEDEMVSYYYQGNEVDEGVFKDVYQVMIAAKYDARIKERSRYYR